MAGVGSGYRFGFIGAGKMATALIKGILRAGLASPDNVIASDVVEAAREKLAGETGVWTTESNLDVVKNSDIIVFAVHPHVVPHVCAEIRDAVGDNHLLVSIAAGVPIARILDAVGRPVRVVRVMPNTPALVGAGAAAYAVGGQATDEDAELVEKLLSVVGIAVRVEERLMDAVTGLSGSGPAYVFQFIEALADGGVRMGLPRAIALTLAAQTVLGAARMVQETGRHPAELKDQVASPGGTTIAGLHELERGALRGTVMNAVEAATRRSTELGKG